MIDIVICQELKKVCPEMTLGCIQAHVKVESSTDNLCEEIDDYCDSLKKEMSIEELASLPRIRDGREAYKKLGKAPSKYRLSSEALIRRALQGKGVYKINNIVDINNLISLKSKFPVGSYDINNLNSPVSLSIGKEGDRYKGIGKELLSIENLPVLNDAAASFGSPTSDSERAMIKDDAKEVLMCVYSFSGSADLEGYLKYAEELLEKYAEGKDIETKIIG
jgi:DNA/RNA-binding domain of Phe-tRNA-synthetase-like protein